MTGYKCGIAGLILHGICFVINVLILIGSALILSNVNEYIDDYNNARKDSIVAICLVVLSILGVILQPVMAIAGCFSYTKYFKEAFVNCCTAIKYLIFAINALFGTGLVAGGATTLATAIQNAEYACHENLSEDDCDRLEIVTQYEYFTAVTSLVGAIFHFILAAIKCYKGVKRIWENCC